VKFAMADVDGDGDGDEGFSEFGAMDGVGSDLLEMEATDRRWMSWSKNREEAHTVAAEELGCGNRSDALHRSN
jgi:hypothetical protein